MCCKLAPSPSPSPAVAPAPAVAGGKWQSSCENAKNVDFVESAEEKTEISCMMMMMMMLLQMEMMMKMMMKLCLGSGERGRQALSGFMQLDATTDCAQLCRLPCRMIGRGWTGFVAGQGCRTPSILI